MSLQACCSSTMNSCIVNILDCNMQQAKPIFFVYMYFDLLSLFVFVFVCDETALL